MKKILLTTVIALATAVSATAQTTKVTIHANQAGAKINREIYGQFSEHLGSCIYGGLVLRWPGGCFADDYHWMDGIGPKNQRPSLRNNNWGGTIEDNSFGTHEFLNLCEMLGCEP